MAWLRALLITLIGKPLARMFTGADVVGREHLPVTGPAIIAANHNSHVDTLMLLTIFKAHQLPKVRPAAASDYFLKDPVVGWFSQNVIGIIPVARDKVKDGEDVLAPARQALAEGCIVIVFPEGTRGDASDGLGRLKNGVARLAEAFPDAPVTPIWLQGAGRVLPKGKAIPVPMNCTVMVGPSIRWEGRRTLFMEALQGGLLALKAAAPRSGGARMRIVSGQFRGKAIITPPGQGTRPTSDRARQAVFNILEHAPWSRGLNDARVIDLFAGSGALGLEALSRGAAWCLFVENDDQARGAIRQNVEAMHLFGHTRIHRRDAAKLGNKPAGDGAPFDLAFLDPPYAKGLGEAALAELVTGGWLAEGAIVVFERGAGEMEIATPGYERLDTRVYGAAQVLFLRRA